MLLVLDHTVRLSKPLSVFLTPSISETLCASVSNYIFKGTLLQMFIACGFLRNVRSETGWDDTSFSDCTNSCRVCIRFHQQTLTIVSGPSGLGHFSNHNSTLCFMSP